MTPFQYQVWCCLSDDKPLTAGGVARRMWGDEMVEWTPRHKAAKLRGLGAVLNRMLVDGWITIVVMENVTGNYYVRNGV